LLVIGFISLGLSFLYIDALGLGIVGVLFGAVVVTTKDGVLIDLDSSKLKGYTSFYGYKYGNWENLRNYGSVSIVISHRVWRIKYMGSGASDVTPREFVVCLLGKSHRKKQNLKRFDAQQDAQDYAKTVSEQLNLPIERYQKPSMN
ncbi:MAG: hypothetical protein JKX73_02140, partial [Flavobacteriales bacterium]|nr:hypothetical protein [Flavobacteriales bacterium]